MKQTTTIIVMAAFMALASAQDTPTTPKRTILDVLPPTFLTGLITMYFIYVMASFGFGELMAIQTPPYQLKYDDKNRDNNREWSKIWGEIEKS